MASLRLFASGCKDSLIGDPRRTPQRIANAPQALAILAGLTASCGALYILLSDAIATGHYGMEHVLMPGIVGITIMSGHLIGNALREARLISALGFLVLFMVGTVLTVYTSVGRQTESQETRASETEATNKAIADKQAELTRARKRYEEAQSYADRERGTSCGRRCQDWSLRATEVLSHIRGLETEIASLGAPKAVDTKADRTAEVVALLLGTDKAKAKATLVLFEPFSYSLFLELTAIVAFGYGFSHRSPKPSRGNFKGETQVSSVEPGEICEWVAWFRRENDRDPLIREVHSKFPQFSKTTCWRRIKET